MKKLLSIITLLLCICSGAWAQTTLLSEDFSNCNGSGGNDGTYNTSANDLTVITSSNLSTYCSDAIASVSDNTNFLVADNCILQKGSSKYLTLKAIPKASFTNASATLTLRVAGWSGTSSASQLKVKTDKATITEEGKTSSKTNRDLTSATAPSKTDWTTYTFNITDVTDALTITIKTNYAYIDDIVVTTETASSATKLDAPEISATAGGKVTSGSVEHATKVTFTTDGTDPTAESTTYTASFDVADGTTVKAIAIGDGEDYDNSTVAAKVIYYTGIKVATPVIKTYNGSVGITSTTPGATIQYSTDGGSNWTTYARTFTLSADATLKAKATRTDCTDSDEASAEVEVVDNGWNHTVYLPLSLFDVGQRAGTSENNLLTGKTGTVAEGYSIAITGRDDKAIISGSNITIGGTAMQSMRVSNGAQNTLTIPDGVEVKGITFFSYNNYDSPDAGWKEVAGTSYEDDTKDSYWGNIPLQANANVEDRLTNPDVRTYALNQTGGTVTYTNANNQPCYVIGVHVVVPEYTVTYYGNGNDEGTAPVDEDSPYGSGSTVTVLGAGTLAKSGNIFAGWNTAADGSGTNYAAGATFTITADTDLYAQWTDVAGSGIIKVQITGGSTSTVTGTIGGSAEVSVQAKSPIDGGYKFGSNGHYVGITLAGGNTFATGDVINVHLTNAPDQGKIKIYDTKTGTNVLYDTDVAGVVGNNFFVLPDEINGLNTIYICRVATTNTWNGYVDFIEVTRPNNTITLNPSGFATYSNDNDFTVTGATIYKMALDTENSTLAGTAVAAGTKIAAGEGILLKGDAGATVSIVETTGAEALEGNDLKGTTLANGTTASKGSANYYVLSGDTFKKYTGAAFAANKAYLESATELSSKLSLIFDDDETTSINNIANGQQPIANGQIYNLAGQKVSESYKGIVIVNGKKYINK